MEQAWPLVLLALRLGVAVALYLFLLAAVRALRAAVRARTMPYAAVAVAPTSEPVRAPSSAPARAQAMVEEPGDRLEIVASDAARAVAEAGALVGRSYALHGPMLVGRGPRNSIVLPEQHVSSRHARLFPHDGAWWVEDLDSTNGTFIDGHRLSGRARLEPSMDVRFGPVAARLVRQAHR
ncbi:MAG: FHA domain-containing protein [Chloroflexota bacterium]